MNDKQTPIIAITGHTSSLATHLINHMKDKYNIITIGRRDSDIYLDVTSFDLDDFTLPQIDVLIHTIAAYPSSTDKEFLNTTDVNIMGTLKMCMAARKSGVSHLVLISSIYASLDCYSAYYTAYAITKKHAEDLASLYCKTHNMKLTILRPSQIYDAEGMFQKSQPLFYTMAHNAKNNENICIYGENDAMRNYLHVNDLVRIIEKVVQKQVLGLYACIYPENIRLSQIAVAALQAFESNAQVIFLKDKPSIPDNGFYDDFSLYKAIGYIPKISIKEGMVRICKHKKNTEK